MKHPAFLSAFLGSILLVQGTAGAGEWPAYLHDARRSGVAEEALSLPLETAWIYHAPHPPRPAWPPPAKADYWHHKRGLAPRMIFDRAFQPVVAAGAVFFGSSADDKVYCLDAATGRERWVFFTGGPVRLAPVVSKDRLYVGSDDGNVYALDVRTGRLLWKRNPSGETRKVIGNGRMISLAPVRTGLVVDQDRLWCTAGLFPLQRVVVAELDAGTGEVRWAKDHDLSPQGYLLASRERLYVPTGRTAPVVFRKSDGARLGAYEGSAGAYALLTEDLLVHGPGDEGRLGVYDAKAGDRLATFDGLRMVVRGRFAYLQTEYALRALDRARYVETARRRNAVSRRLDAVEKSLKAVKEEKGDEKIRKARALEVERASLRADLAAAGAELAACDLWERPCDCPYALILAGELLFAGGEDRVAAFRTRDGEEVWGAALPGRVYGLAVAEGALYASTDTGTIHCFRSKDGAGEGREP